MGNQVQQQLQMLWPTCLLDAPPEVHLPSDYKLRDFQPDVDTEDYLAVVHAVGFTHFTPESVANCLNHILPGGLFVIVHVPTGEIVATAMANHAPSDLHPFGGELGWVAGSPAHAEMADFARIADAAKVANALNIGSVNITSLLTSVGDPGVDTALVTDQGIREAIDAAVAGKTLVNTSFVATPSSWSTTTTGSFQTVRAQNYTVQNDGATVV